MITLGLSGSRYSGKKTTVEVFKRIGIPVFDADLILKFILNQVVKGFFISQITK